MRVLHVYAGNLFGGIEKLLLILAEHRGLCPELEQHFTLCFEGALSRGLRALNAPLHMLSPVRLRNPLSVYRARRGLGKLLDREHFDVIVTHACWPHAIFSGVARRRGIPIAFCAHDAMHPKLHFTEKMAARVPPSLVLSNSRYTAGTLHRLFPNVPTETYYGPVVPPIYSDRAAVRARLRAELATSPDDIVILLASRLEPWKGHTLLIDALSRLKDSPGWRCWLTSNAQRPHEVQYLAELQAQAKRLEIQDRVQFLGDRPDVADLMLSADIHCQPNLGPEPFGRVFVEALFAGLAVVTTDLGGGSEILIDGDARYGIVVAPNDAEALASSLATVIGDAQMRRQLAEAGPARAASLCAPQQSITRFHDLLKQIL
jgi:glycosyltransferase involved in cell wall biosynthesis